MKINLERLNEMNQLLFRLNESLINVCWGGREQLSDDVFQLVNDTDAMSRFMYKLRDEVASELDATFDSDGEKFIVVK